MNDRFWVFRVPQEDEALAKVKDKKAVAVDFGVQQSIENIADKNLLKEIYRASHPGTSDPRVNMAVGQLYRVAQVIKKGDWILTPKKNARTVLYGQAKGGYEYLPNIIAQGFSHAIRVDWKGQFPRDAVSSSLRNGMGGISTVFNIDRHSNELLRVMGQIEPGVPTTQEIPQEVEPEAVAFYDEIRYKSEELITDLIAKIDPYDIQDLVAGLLEAMGYKTHVSPPGRDGGVDIIAHPDPLGFEAPRIKVQVKHRKEAAGGPMIRELKGVLTEGEKGLFVSTGGFTTEGKNEARKTSNITLMDADEFVKQLIEHYEKLDSDYKSIIPLRKVWLPVS